MSLKEADWKAVLNKPKNLGLKAVGTGVSIELRKLEEYRSWYAKNPDMQHAKLFAQQAMQVNNICKEAANKHKKLFTEASEYLTQVAKLATDEFEDATGQVLKAMRYKLKYVPPSHKLDGYEWDGHNWVKPKD